VDKIKWIIIQEKSVQGDVQYSVCDDFVGYRMFSYNFRTLAEAKECLKQQENKSE